ncbi:MAG TPA: A/G-specific adenine glycosylase, partial [Pirellulales bacterium]
FRARLLAWYDHVKRDMPWRRTHDPYAIWVSETMLQQTTVAMATPHYLRFLQTFPTVADLAASDEQQVLRLWEGLGYYSRARNLRRAAQVVVDRHGGEFPSSLEELQALPGVGRYTAGAVRSFAFNQPAPIIEANTRRLWARLVGLTGDATSRAGESVLWRAAGEILSPERVRETNQALMELGALVCTPREPKCLLCPVSEFCEARRLGVQAVIPAMKPKPVFTAVREAAVVVHRGDEVLVLQNPLGGRWAGLWDFPRFTWDEDVAESGEAPRIAAWLIAQVAERTGVAIGEPSKLATIKYGITRYRVTLDAFRADALPAPKKRGSRQPVAESPAPANAPLLRWINAAALETLPLCVTGRKMSRLALE